MEQHRGSALVIQLPDCAARPPADPLRASLSSTPLQQTLNRIIYSVLELVTNAFIWEYTVTTVCPIKIPLNPC